MGDYDISVPFASAVADFINGLELTGSAMATVDFKPVYDPESEDVLKIRIIPAGNNTERVGFDTIKRTAFAEIGFQKFVGDPFDATQIISIIELMDTVQFAATFSEIIVDDVKFKVDRIEGDSLYDAEHLINASLFTGVLLLTATATYRVSI